jgi:oxygen-independent coproporphyrinogen-3 oxidase
MPNTTAIYIHWPFCESKCPYCDFNSHVREQVNIDDWKAGFSSAIASYQEYLHNKTITSIFFGGGTPTLMPPSLLAHIIEQLNKTSALDNNVEISMEGNPSSTEMESLKHFAAAGVNRVSLGIQSLEQKELEFLGRRHNAKEALTAIETVRNIFNNYNFDLIYARPNQSVGAWEKELSKALSYTGRHLSLYQLTIEKGTPFYNAYRRKEFSLPSEETSAQLYELTSDITSSFGLAQYEVSNYAAPGYECQHNLTYWKYGDYLGIGPGAHSRITNHLGHKYAQMDIHHPENWLKQALSDKGTALQQKEVITEKEQAIEGFMMGMRLNEGIELSSLPTESIISQPGIKRLASLGLIAATNHCLKITEKGRLLTNQIIAELIDN